MKQAPLTAEPKRNNGRSRTAQAQQHAEQARRKAERRREEQSGISGWVADRASEWSLDGPDWPFMERQKYLWNPLMDYWFRMEVDGWEKIPEPPVLLVGIHSGAPFVWDAWTVGVQWWRHFGRSRALHGTAHDALMALPGVGGYFRRMGVRAGRAGQHLGRAGRRPRRRPVAGRRARLAAALDQARPGDPRRPQGLHQAGHPQRACRSCRSPPWAGRTRCRCWPPAAGWPR